MNIPYSSEQDKTCDADMLQAAKKAWDSSAQKDAKKRTIPCPSRTPK